MKKIYFLVLFAISMMFLPKQSEAQLFRLNLYSGYNFDDNIDAITNGNNFFNGTIKGGYQWGLGFEYILKPTYGIELLYYRMNTDVDINYNTGRDTSASFGLGSNFIMLSGNKYLPIPRSIVSPYGSLMLGLSIMTNEDPLPGAEDTRTSFAWGGRLGVSLNVSKNVGLNLFGQLMSAVQSVGGGVYLGTGGVSTGLSSESSMYQFGLGGALVIKFGKAKSRMIPRK
jgi:hypothetical protein